MGDSGFSLIPLGNGGDVTGVLYTFGEVTFGRVNFAFGDIFMVGESLGVHGDCFGDNFVSMSTL